MKEIRKNNSNNTGSDTIVFFPFDTLYQGIHPLPLNLTIYEYVDMHIHSCPYLNVNIPPVMRKKQSGWANVLDAIHV